MDASELALHWDKAERLGIIPLVAEIEGKVIGHLDLLFCEELPLGSFLLLDVLMVHNDYRRSGVASVLIKEAEWLAKLAKTVPAHFLSDVTGNPSNIELFWRAWERQRQR